MNRKTPSEMLQDRVTEIEQYRLLQREELIRKTGRYPQEIDQAVAGVRLAMTAQNAINEAWWNEYLEKK
ncbi:hypothetical protein ACQ4M3_09660 [Leptolyngbya sp. AN03gr2]|uniref:hypothetical protein n=1 Tax=Leptolyngbya sp. AN03gr2 TaxID=3423364 RepID=UPI003D324635